MAGFHVEFGINETQLTRLLERGLYKEAENLIIENNTPSYLDEGCYQRTPLFIVLNGEYETGQVRSQRNLYIAKLLVEYGACVNYRVPITDGAEYVSPGSTPLELAVEYFLALSSRQAFLNLHGHEENPETGTTSSGAFVDELDENVTGMNNKALRSIADVKDHLLDLIFIMLSNGGNINIRDEYGQTLLHRSIIMMGDDDSRLIQLLVESSVDLNAVDHKGNTPLAALCEMQIDYTSRKSQKSTRRILQYLLTQETIQVDKENKADRTALFGCMIRGNIIGASLLLQYGADPAKRGKVKSVNEEIDTGIKYLSPLFAYLCSPQAFTKQSASSDTGKVAHLVDAGYFNTAYITHELHEYTDEDFQSFEHLKIFGNTLINLMFGKTTASLRQLCVRNIFQSCFVKPSSAKQSLLGIEDKLRQEDIDLDSDLDLNLNDKVTYWSNIITTEVLEGLISRLSLPADSLLYFEVELFTQQLCSKLCMFRYPEEEYQNILEWFSESDELSSGDEGESDIEYW